MNLRRINLETLKNLIIWSERQLRQFITAVPEKSKICTLEIEGFAMNPDIATALSAIIPRMPHLRKFRINNSDCSDVDGLSILASALANKASLTDLRLNHCLIENEGAEIIASSFGDNSTLKSLSLGGNSIGDEGAIALASLVSGNSSIRTVILMHNNIEVDGMSDLAASLCENRSVESIDLRGNTDEPDTHIKRALYNDASIESVIASNHTITFIGLDSYSPSNEDLRRLVDLNRAGPEKAVRAKIIRFLNEQPTFVLAMGIEGYVIPSYMEKIGSDCQLNTMFELIRNMPSLFETG